jgi:hypothetical protein
MTKKLSIAGLVVAAAASSAFAFGAAPARAACLPSDPSSICATFNPSTTTNIQGYDAFTGAFTPPVPYTKARVQFAFTGAWTTPFTISNISITGDGITTGLSFANKTISDLTEPGFDAPHQTAYVDLNSSVNSFDFSNSTITFTFPGGVAPLGGTISARIQYSSADGSQLNTSGGNFLSTASGPPVPTPGPLPILGAGAAFGFSRSMRRRIAQSI